MFSGILEVKAYGLEEREGSIPEYAMASVEDTTGA